MATVMTAPSPLRGKVVLENYDGGNSSCSHLYEKDCAFEMFSTSIQSPTTDANLIILWVAVGAYKIMQHKNKVTEKIDKDEKKHFLIKTTLDLAKWSYVAIRRNKEIYKPNHRFPSSIDDFDETIRRLETTRFDIKHTDKVNIAMLRIFDENMIRLNLDQSEKDLEASLATLINQETSYKFNQVGSSKIKGLLEKLNGEVPDDMELEYQKYNSYFSNNTF